MAITTLQGVVDGLLPPIPLFEGVNGHNAVGQYLSSWASGGLTPAAGAYDSTLDGAALVSPVTGQIALQDPVSGEKSYLARWTFRPRRGDVLANFGGILIDRLWHNGGIDATSTSAQTITSPAWPARDEDDSTNGAGVYLAVELETNMGAATPTITVEYTNSAGVTGRTSTNIMPTLSGQLAGTWIPMSLQTGDVGIRSVQSVTLSASWISGTMHLVAYRFLCAMPETVAQGYCGVDAVTANFPRLGTGAVPFIIGQSYSTSGSTGFTGEIQFTQG